MSFQGFLSVIMWACLFAGPAYAKMGFHFFDQGAVPQALEAAPENIFQMLAPAGQNKSIDITGWTEAQILQHAKGISKNRWRPDLRIFSVQHQLKTCQQLKASPCLYKDGLIPSTAFLLKQPRMLIATYHGMRAYINTLKKMGADDVQISAMNLGIVLLNSIGEVVSQAPKALALYPTKNYEGDLVMMAADQLSSEGLAFDPDKKVNKNTKLYAAGFPEPTKGREKYGVENAVLDTLTYTQGQLTNTNRLRLSNMMTYYDMHDENQPMENPYFVTDLDGSSGMSGGPLITEDGYVVGYLAKGMPPRGKNEVTSIFVNLVRALK